MNELRRWYIAGFIFVLIFGTLAHFMYDWTGENFIVGLIFPTSESTWEHMKLVFFPMLAFGLCMICVPGSKYPCNTKGILWGVIIGTFLIPVIFYTYVGIVGRNFLVADIAVFVVSVACGFAAAYRLAVRCKADAANAAVPAVITAVLFIAFMAFSYNPPELGLFVLNK